MVARRTPIIRENDRIVEIGRFYAPNCHCEVSADVFGRFSASNKEYDEVGLKMIDFHKVILYL